MGLETGTGIGDLVPTNPLSTDAVSAGDDHLRLIKTVMQSITGNFRSIQTFTANGTWTRPANIKKILIYCQGSGAGGGGGLAGGYSGGGGSSGAIAIKWLDVTAIASAQVMVGGAGLPFVGAGGAVGNPGLEGADSYFLVGGTNYVCVAFRGKPGINNYDGGVAAPAASSTGDIVFPGASGAHGMFVQGTGATSFGGIGAGGGGGTGTAAQANSGGGGGGGAITSTVENPGGNGGTGLVVIFEFGW